ncbi:uncharacterized protein si:ch211-152f22.4 isoform X5 [Triplophysa dalaica]|uniref:uncharacterized protein si:ch211-152f22.4 isoform X5 n=1 Tax=Triplophysa dalaica TaxID=1582913 RepID=UPI0024DF8AAB|nr:uncharacterized protein si:ch211-152f22.4 isoform X5 [Triplophysa dalaica]
MHNISPLFLHNMAKIPMSGPQWCFRQNKQTRFAKDPYGRDRQQDRLGAGRTGRSQRCNPYMQDPLAKYRGCRITANINGSFYSRECQLELGCFHNRLKD